MAELISIPSTTSAGSTIYYEITLKLPLRTFTIKRRYSEFEDLVTNLCHDIGIDYKEFPYPLPSKRINWFKNKTNSIVGERKVELAQFLNSVIADSAIQNNPILHKFLQIPVNFKFNPNLFRISDHGGNREADLHIELESIDENNWLEIVRILKSEILDQSGSKAGLSINDKIQVREKINRIYQPCLVKLIKSLPKLKLDSKELSRRQTVLEDLKNSVNGLVENLEARQKQELVNVTSISRRVLGQAQETKETIALNNNELLQQQMQVQKQQDQELEQLRLIIQRQRQIGEAINSEVEEQNELLDQFNDEVDNTTDKVRLARKRARQIL